MGYAKLYFGKEDVTDILYEDVVKFFSFEREESDKVEYKSYVSTPAEQIKEKTKGVLRAICGFLNSEGGLLIWGAPVGKKIEGRKEKVFTGELSMVDELFEKDSFISKITDSITPAPKSIQFHRIENNGKYIYLFEVSKSEYSPHMYDNTFFMRIDGQTKPAPHHYIEALFKKIRYPNINAYLKIEQWKKTQNLYELSVSPYFFNSSPLQNDYHLTYRILCHPGKFQGSTSINLNPKTTFDHEGAGKIRTDIKDVLHYGEPVHELSVIQFDPNELQKEKWEITIILTFGAELSPLKMCIYKLRMASFVDPMKLNDCFIEIKENVLSFELSGKTEQEKIEGQIGRKIN